MGVNGYSVCVNTLHFCESVELSNLLLKYEANVQLFFRNRFRFPEFSSISVRIPGIFP